MERIEEYLDEIPLWAAKKNSLHEIRTYLEELGNPDESMKIIHVAGTNGKGSVCAFMASVLTEAGYSVGAFISPHLEETRERFLINGELVCRDTYEQAFETVRTLSETMTRRGYHPPTYFEFLFYMSMVINTRHKTDYVILETGLGGRLDVTNVIRHPELVILTSISMDHMEYLGSTVEEIAWEKAGIIKNGIPVVYDDSQPMASEIIIARAEELNSPIYPVGVESYTLMGRDETYTRIAVSDSDGGCLEVDIPSIAEYQMMNVTLVLKALEVLTKTGDCRMTPGDIRNGISLSRWPGRMEQIRPGLYLDGAHNAGGVEALVRTMVRLREESGKQIHLLFSVVSDKEYKIMIDKICRNLTLKSVSVAHITSERGLDPQVLVAEFKKVLDCPVAGFATAEEALRNLLSQKEDGDLAFCAGSLYLIGEIRQVLNDKNFPDRQEKQGGET